MVKQFAFTKLSNKILMYMFYRGYVVLKFAKKNIKREVPGVDKPCSTKRLQYSTVKTL